MRFGRSMVVLLFLVSLPSLAQNNPELIAMFSADQADRRSENIDWAVVGLRDAERRESVIAILEEGGIRTALDYYNAAMVFQHGESEDDIRLAHAFATISSALMSTDASNWLKAASWDRLMLRYEQPQWYGTQYLRDDSGGWALYDVHPDAVTDQERAAWSVPSLEDAHSRAALMNGEP